MAFHIILNPAWAAENGIKKQTYVWSIQDKKPEFNIPYVDGQLSQYLYRTGIQVDLLQADGTELDLIRVKFNNLPIANKEIVTWRGDMASFIFNNL